MHFFWLVKYDSYALVTHDCLVLPENCDSVTSYGVVAVGFSCVEHTAHVVLLHE